MRKGSTRIRTVYINAKGELYLQFYTAHIAELDILHVGYCVAERLQSGYQAEGEISRITQSGLVLKNWRLI